MAADVDPVYLGHHDVQQDQVRLLGASDGQRLFAVGRREDFIAVDSKAGLEDVQVHWLIIHNEDAWRRSHVLFLVTGTALAYGRYPRIFARSARGLKGFEM